MITLLQRAYCSVLLAEVNLDTTGPKVDLENRISEYFENKTYSSVEGGGHLGDSSADEAEESVLVSHSTSGPSEPVVATVAFPSSASSLSESSDVCKCYAVVDELRRNVMELRCKVDSIHVPAETSEISLLRERNKSLEKSIEELKSEKDALLVALRLVSTNLPASSCSFDGSIAPRVHKPESNAKAQRPTITVPSSTTSSNGAAIPTTNVAKKRKKATAGRLLSDNIENRSSTNRPAKHVVILGDSIVKFVDGRKVSRSSDVNVSVHSFSGSRVEDMKDYIQPSLKKKPDEIILHVGTNNLSSDEPLELANNISSLAKLVQESSIKVSLSSITTRDKRKNEPDLKHKISSVNNHLKELARSNGYGFINNDNIDSNCLNRSLLHLNSEGTRKLSDNFKAHIIST